MPAFPSLPDAIQDLRNLFGDRVATGEAVRAQHANTVSWRTPELPDAVVWPLATEDVVAIVAVARKHRVPLIPFGAGTSLEGQVNAPLGGISVDFSRMTRILAVEPRDLDCTVEPGVTRPMSTRTSAISVFSSRSTRARPTPRSAAWRRRGPQARMRCGTARCARMFSR